MNYGSAGLFVAFVLLAATPAHAGSGTVQRVLQANYNRLSAAFQSHDLAGIEAIMAQDVTLTTPTHETWGRARILADLKQQSALMKDATWQRKVTGVAVRGDQAVATVRGAMHATFAGQNGQRHAFDLSSVSADTWVRRGKVWKLKHAHTIVLHTRIDGQTTPDRASKPR